MEYFDVALKQVGPDHVKVLHDKHSSDQGIYTVVYS